FKITNIQHGTLYLNDGTTAVSSGDFLAYADAQMGRASSTDTEYIGKATVNIQASTSNADAGLGGSTASASISVAGVADTPSVTGASTNEDTQSTSRLVICRNAADGTEVTHFKITNIQHGTLYLNDGTTAVSNGDFLAYADA